MTIHVDQMNNQYMSDNYNVQQLAHLTAYTEAQILLMIVRRELFAFTLLDGMVLVPLEEASRVIDVGQDEDEDVPF